MTNVHQLPDRYSARGKVATEVRSELAKARISVNKLPTRIGKSQSYWFRRISAAELPLDVDDLTQLAELLDVPVTRFFEGPGQDLDLRPAVTVRHQGLEPRTRWLSLTAGQRHQPIFGDYSALRAA